jgi:hypothetical protein
VSTGAQQSARAATASIPRCPACGQPLSDPTPETCPLCSVKLPTSGDRRATGNDVTPYATAFNADEPARLIPMYKWVWFAGHQRLKHLAMMRASDAAERFAWIHLLILTLALGAFYATALGWRFVSSAEASTSNLVRPTGKGWFRVAEVPNINPTQATSPLAGLWWNPAHSLLGGAIAIVAAFILIAIARALIRSGLELAHAKQYRGEQRMTAATCYATAWLVPVIAATIFLWVRPTVFVAGEATIPGGDMIFLLPAGILAAIGLIFGWFWFLRLAATAPVDTRTRVTIMCALGIPAIILAGAAAWWYGLERICDPLFSAMNMSFS